MAITWNGDVTPVGPVSSFSDPASLNDLDGDGHADYLFLGGNTVLGSSGSITDPTGGTGTAWDSVEIWANYDSPFDVKSGVTGRGELYIEAVSCRVGDLTVGDVAGSDGLVTITGSAHFCNDRDSIPRDVRVAISRASGGSITPEAVTYDDIGDEANHPWSGKTKVPQPAGNHNLHVGKAGVGRALITDSAIVEVRHQLLIGGAYNEDETPLFVAAAGGWLRIDNASLHCHGKYLADTESPETVTDAEPSQIAAGSRLEVAASSLYLRTGLVNAGALLVESAEGSIYTSGTTTLIHADDTFELVNTGLIHVRAGATLRVSCPINNQGEIYLESGAVLEATGGIDPSSTGVIRRSPCCPAAILIVEGEVTIPAACAKELTAG